MSSEFTLLANFRWVGVNAGVTPFILLIYPFTHLMDKILVNIMFLRYNLQYRRNALLYISNQLFVISLCVMSY